MVEEIHIEQRVKELKQKASARLNVPPEKCHIGHVALQAMLDSPDSINQIDAVTDTRETNLSVATRSTRLASAMTNYGLKVGDHVVIISHNHLDLAIPYFACHYNGYAMCAMDPSIILADLESLFQTIHPKMIFCPKGKTDEVKKALEKNDKLDGHIVTFDDQTNNLETFISNHKGTDVNFKPADFDHSKTICWLMLTSGTTGLPKVAIIPFDTLLNGLCAWWSQFTIPIQTTMAMATIQWMSSLVFFITGPLMQYTRVQASVPLTPQLLVGLINKYKPNVTAWTPYLLGQFLAAAGNFCDLSHFKYIAIGGSAIEKPLLDKFREKCKAYLYLVYGMTELLVPVFDFNKDTPFGSTGKEYEKFQYRLVAEDGNYVTEPNMTGELWLKGDAFFKGYLNNKEETDKILTDDGWVKTGDIFYKDEQGFYYFVERARLLIKHLGYLMSPLQLEEIIKKHPGVEEACVVGIPDQSVTESPVAVIVKRKGRTVEPQEIFALIAEVQPETRRLHGGLFFMDALPETPSGKIHRSKLKDIAISAKRIFAQ